MIKVQSVQFEGPAGRIEGLLKFREGIDPAALAVVCHPHPLYQGTMHNKVVFAIAEAFFSLGCDVLRFNFRGVGLSAGSHNFGKGEVDDALAAISFLRARHPGTACHLAGFSFGAGIALQTACHDMSLASVTAVAPSFKFSDPACLSSLPVPKLFLQGTADSICSPDDLRRLYPGFLAPKSVVWLESAEHFFAREIDALKTSIAEHRQFLGL
jgi:alpha/beta superfamily hydrolase